MSEQAQVYIKQDNRIITVGQRWGIAPLLIHSCSNYIEWVEDKFIEWKGEKILVKLEQIMPHDYIDEGIISYLNNDHGWLFLWEKEDGVHYAFSPYEDSSLGPLGPIEYLKWDYLSNYGNNQDDWKKCSHYGFLSSSFFKEEVDTIENKGIKMTEEEYFSFFNEIMRRSTVE